MPLLHNRYKYIREIGSGGSGIVSLMEDTQTHQHVAVKQYHRRFVLREMGGQHQEIRESWAKETELLGSLQHPQIPEYIETFTEEIEEEGELVKKAYLVQEYIEGQSLSEWMQTQHSLQDGIAILGSLLEVLTYLQALTPPVIHRDIKPQNIVQDGNGQWHLIDFGTALAAAHRTVGHTMGVGTLGYQAPEQFGGQPVPGSDLYSLGVIAVQMFTGLQPSDMLQHTATLAWSPKTQSLAPDVREWLRKMLAPVGERYISAAEAIAGLRPLGYQPVTSFENPSFQDDAELKRYNQDYQEALRRAQRDSERSNTVEDWLYVAVDYQNLAQVDEMNKAIANVITLLNDEPFEPKLKQLKRCSHKLGFLPVLQTALQDIEAEATDAEKMLKLADTWRAVGYADKARYWDEAARKNLTSRVDVHAKRLARFNIDLVAPSEPYTLEAVVAYETDATFRERMDAFSALEVRAKAIGWDIQLEDYETLDDAGLQQLEDEIQTREKRKFRGADLQGANLRRADLRDTDLNGADLNGADLRGADLRDTDLRDTDLRGADLRGANLRSADFNGADLNGADLRGADLRGADLRGADLRGADLKYAKLTGDYPVEANVQDAIYNRKTRWPNQQGTLFDPVASGATLITDSMLNEWSITDLREIGVTSLRDRKAVMKAIAEVLEEEAAKKAEIEAEKKRKIRLAQQKASGANITLITVLLLLGITAVFGLSPLLICILGITENF